MPGTAEDPVSRWPCQHDEPAPHAWLAAGAAATCYGLPCHHGAYGRHAVLEGGSVVICPGVPANLAGSQPADFAGSPLPANLAGSGPLTVENLVRDPRMIGRRLEELSRQRSVIAQLFPPTGPPTRRQRLRNRAWRGRDSVARWLAPWLDGGTE